MTGEPRSDFVSVEGARLHYIAYGDADASALVLVHGLRDQARSWDRVAEAFASRYYVVAPDLRGHGDSDRAGAGGYAIANFVIDLADVVDALGLTSVALVGHSLGGAIALRYAAAFPDRVRALCVIEGVELPIIRDERQTPKPYPVRLRAWVDLERQRRRRAPRRYASAQEASARMVETQPGLDAATIAGLARHAVVADADGGVRWKHDNAARFRAPEDADGRDLDAALGAIACPTLLLYGEASWIPVPAASRLGLIGDHRVVTFAGASHWLHHQQRDAFVAAVGAFLDTTAESTLHA